MPRHRKVPYLSTAKASKLRLDRTPSRCGMIKVEGGDVGVS